MTSRREFLSTCACLLATGGAVGCASVAVRPVPRTGDVVTISLTDYPALAKAGGSAKVLPTGAEDPLYILALGDSRFAALSPICTHRGCTVEIEGARLVCPCHGSTYDREGKVLRGPAERALERFEVSVSGTDLRIKVPS